MNTGYMYFLEQHNLEQPTFKERAIDGLSSSPFSSFYIWNPKKTNIKCLPPNLPWRFLQNDFCFN